MSWKNRVVLFWYSLEDDVIERVRISDVIMHVWGDKECKWESDKIPTQRNQRAEGRNYKGTLPAKGIFARNILDFDYQNIKILSHSSNTKKRHSYDLRTVTKVGILHI